MRRDRCSRSRGLALPLVLVIGTACQMIVGVLLESVRGEVRSSGAKAHAAETLAAAERTLGEAGARLTGTLAFPANGCDQGLCANRQAPAADAYDWQTGTTHAKSTSVPTGAYWVEILGTLAAGQSADCTGSSGGCEYVRVVASAARDRGRRTLEAHYRIRRTAGFAPVVVRISWRETSNP